MAPATGTRPPKWTNELGNANVPVAGGSNDYVITFDGGRANYAAFNVNSGGTGVINSAVIVNSDDSDGGATLGEFAGLGDNGLVTNINGAAWYSE